MPGYYTDGLPVVDPADFLGPEQFVFDTTRAVGSPPQSGSITWADLLTAVAAQVTVG